MTPRGGRSGRGTRTPRPTCGGWSSVRSASSPILAHSRYGRRMSADPRAALTHLVAAFERHLEVASSRRDPTTPRCSAAEDLADAFADYDDALFDAYGEMTPLDIYDDDDEDEDDDGGDDDEDDDERRGRRRRRRRRRGRRDDDDDDEVDEDDLDDDETSRATRSRASSSRSRRPACQSLTSSSAATISAGSSRSSLASGGAQLRQRPARRRSARPRPAGRAPRRGRPRRADRRGPPAAVGTASTTPDRSSR